MVFNIFERGNDKIFERGNDKCQQVIRDGRRYEATDVCPIRFGPMPLRALRRLALICRNVVIGE
jgi:hypothetical protein